MWTAAYVKENKYWAALEALFLSALFFIQKKYLKLCIFSM